MVAPSKSSISHTLIVQEAVIVKPGFVPDAHRFSQPARFQIALAGFLLGCPAMMVTFVALLIAGRTIIEALLMALGLQFLVFCVVIVVALARSKNATPTKFAGIETNYGHGTTDK